MSPNQLHNRRFMFYLLMISSAIFALSVTERMREQREQKRMKGPDYESQLPKTYKEGARTVIPRELNQAKTDGSAGGVQVVMEEAEEEGIVDTSLQGGLPAPTEFLEGEALRTAFARTMRDEATEDIMECLNAWWMLDPGIEGRVELEVVIGDQGLKEAAILDHTAVPFGPLSCFSTALYRTAWPGSSEGDVVILQPVVFSNALPEEPEEEPSALDALGEATEDTGD
jgi:hypothetical protein